MKARIRIRSLIIHFIIVVSTEKFVDSQMSEFYSYHKSCNMSFSYRFFLIPVEFFHKLDEIGNNVIIGIRGITM